MAAAGTSNGYTPFSSCTSRPVTGGLKTHTVRIRVSGLCAECPDLPSGPSDHGVVRPIECLPAGVSLDEHLERIEAGLIAWALRATGGNKSRAAELLHIKRTTLADRISRLGARLTEASGGFASAPDGSREHRP